MRLNRLFSLDRGLRPRLTALRLPAAIFHLRYADAYTTAETPSPPPYFSKSCAMRLLTIFANSSGSSSGMLAVSSASP